MVRHDGQQGRKIYYLLRIIGEKGGGVDGKKLTMLVNNPYKRW